MKVQHYLLPCIFSLCLSALKSGISWVNTNSEYLLNVVSGFAGNWMCLITQALVLLKAFWVISLEVCAIHQSPGTNTPNIHSCLAGYSSVLLSQKASTCSSHLNTALNLPQHKGRFLFGWWSYYKGPSTYFPHLLHTIIISTICLSFHLLSRTSTRKGPGT